MQNTQYSKSTLVYCWFIYTPQRWGSVFLSWHLSVFVCTADCQSSRNLKLTLFQIFRIFLTTGNFTLYMSTMLEEKICQFGHKLGDMINSDWIIKKGSLTTSSHLSIKIILVSPNLVLTFFGKNFFRLNYGAQPWK